MIHTLLETASITDALKAAASLRARLESIELDAKTLRLVREAGCAEAMLALLRQRSPHAWDPSARDQLQELRAAESEIATIRGAVGYFVQSIDKNETEILRLARRQRCRLEMLDYAGAEADARFLQEQGETVVGA